ncbi:MAG: hypothetical protein Ta2G_12910 [Termitinemataceae bacterium]|nr:MAG: hypothetical protein Ta2G_12910 [Termitinemataceae bacterium]
MHSIKLLYEDETCLIFDKPAGLAVQGGQNVKTSLDSILTQEAGGENRPLLVHRLDKETSGIILLAKNKMSAAFYTKTFFYKEAVKKYIALCFAKDDSLPPCGKITTPIAVSGLEKTALTFYKASAAQNNGSFTPLKIFELSLGTGRMHQIRKHLASNGAPIVGDDKYGDFKLNKIVRKKGIKNMMLHASSLEIKNPSGKIINVTSELPEYFIDMVKFGEKI